MSAADPAPARNRRHRGWGSFALVAGSLVVALGGGEIVCRALHLRGWHEPRTRGWRHAMVPDAERIPGVSVQFKPYSSVEYVYDSNPRHYFNERNSLVYRMNRWGFRGPDFVLQKPPGTKRIAILGDSFTFGEGVRLEDTFCARLQDLLSRDLHQPVEVLNLGISAWGTSDEIRFYERSCAFLQPDLTIVVYVLNDADHAGGLDVWENFRLKYENRNLRWSFLASYVYASIGRRLVARRYIESLVQSAMQDRRKWDESFALLSHGRDVAHSQGSKYVVALFPFMYDLSSRNPFRGLHRMVAEYCAQDSIPFLDLFPDFQGRSYTDLWVHPTDQHPNEIGHGIAAQALARYIESTEILNSEPPGR